LSAQIIPITGGKIQTRPLVRQRFIYCRWRNFGRRPWPTAAALHITYENYCYFKQEGKSGRWRFCLFLSSALAAAAPALPEFAPPAKPVLRFNQNAIQP
jgi:hypothetical protein